MTPEEFEKHVERRARCEMCGGIGTLPVIGSDPCGGFGMTGQEVTCVFCDGTGRTAIAEGAVKEEK